MNAPTLREPEGFTCDDIPTRAVGHVTTWWGLAQCSAAPHPADIAQCVTAAELADLHAYLERRAEEEAEEEDRRRAEEAEAAEARHNARHGAIVWGWGAC